MWCSINHRYSDRYHMALTTEALREEWENISRSFRHYIDTREVVMESFLVVENYGSQVVFLNELVWNESGNGNSWILQTSPCHNLQGHGVVPVVTGKVTRSNVAKRYSGREHM